MNNVMLDFETLGTEGNKCLCQVGAVYFDPDTGEVGNTFKMNIDAGNHQKEGGQLLADTMYWWLGQSKEAQQSLFTDRKPIREVMEALDKFLEPATRIWSYAPFDFVTLMDTFGQLKMKTKVKYKNAMDIRTLVNLFGINLTLFPRENVHHDARDDCKHQVKYCTAALQRLKLSKKLTAKLKDIID